MTGVTPVTVTEEARATILGQVTTGNPHANNASGIVDTIIHNLSEQHIHAIDNLVDDEEAPENGTVNRDYRDGSIVVVTVFDDGNILEHTMYAADEVP